MKKIVACINLIFLLVILTGCWNRRELDTLSVVQAVGIDRTEDNKISFSVQILKPGVVKTPGGGEGGGGDGKAVWVVTSTGKTVFEAIRNATAESDRKLYFSHNKIIVIGEEAAKSGIAPLLDLFDRDPEGRLRPFMFIARGKAKDILEAEHGQEKIPAKAIESLAKAAFATSKIARVEMIDILKTFAGNTSAPFIPGIETLKHEEDKELKEMVKLDGTAIFKKDKLIGWFDGKETRGLLWVLGKVKSGIIVVKSPKEEDKYVSLEITSASGRIKPEIEDGNITITVEVKMEGNLGEQMSKVNLTKLDTFKELEKMQAAAIKEEIYSALDKAQKEWGTDIFKFGEEVRRRYPKEWKELKEKWDEEFKNIDVKVEVEAKLRRVGMSTRPAMGED